MICSGQKKKGGGRRKERKREMKMKEKGLEIIEAKIEYR